jgi:hypothetical protein
MIMQNKNTTWDDLVSNWDHMDNNLNNETMNITELKTQLVNRNNSSIIAIVLETALALALCSYIIYEIINGLPSVMDYTLYTGIFIIVLASLLISISTRAKGLKDKAKNSFEYLNLLYKKSQMIQKILKISKASCVSLFLLCYGIITWVFVLWLQSDHDIAKPLFALSLVGFVSIFFPSMYYWLKVQQKQYANYQLQLQKMIKELDE